MTKDEWIQILDDTLGLEPEDIMEILEAFFESTSNDLPTIKNAFASGDFATVQRLVHGIKGASANIAFDDVSELARTLEADAKNQSIPDFDNRIQALSDLISTKQSFLG